MKHIRDRRRKASYIVGGETENFYATHSRRSVTVGVVLILIVAAIIPLFDCEQPALQCRSSPSSVAGLLMPRLYLTQPLLEARLYDLEMAAQVVQLQHRRVSVTKASCGL